jgi:hypothetical protein
MDDICPWSTLAPATLQWCERQLCAWIREPANTWSNLAFIIVGIMIIAECKKSNLPQKVLGFFAILLGLMSGFYHASGTLVGEIVDFSSMFLISVYLISANYARLYGWTQKKSTLSAIALGLLTIAILVIEPLSGSFLFAGQVTWFVALEFVIWRKSTVKPSYKWFVFSFIALQSAFLIWNLDRLKIICYPDFHWVNGHAIWHVLTATSLWFIFKFYSQFRKQHS